MKDIISAKSSKNKDQINKILSSDLPIKDVDDEVEQDDLASMQIVVDLAPPELTFDEEKNFTIHDAKMADKKLTNIRES